MKRTFTTRKLVATKDWRRGIAIERYKVRRHTIYAAIAASVLLGLLIAKAAAQQQTPPTVTILNVYYLTDVTLREVTAYNVGDPHQTDASPCIGAAGTNLCEAIEQGERICAANWVPLGTTLYIDGYGKCIVQDRMNSRYPEAVDIALAKAQKAEAQSYGRQLRKVYKTFETKGGEKK